MKNVKGIHQWLWERETLRLGRFKIEARHYEIEGQINQMIDEYDEYCSLAWPEEWEDLVCSFSDYMTLFLKKNSCYAKGRRQFILRRRFP